MLEMGGDPKNPVWPAARPFFLPLFAKSLVAAISEIRHLVYGRYDTWQMQAHEGTVEHPYYDRALGEHPPSTSRISILSRLYSPECLGKGVLGSTYAPSSGGNMPTDADR
jgi:hypothetical protein